MAKPRLTAPILLGVVTVFALILLTSGDREKEAAIESMRQTFHVEAIYYPNSEQIEVSYLDRSAQTDSVVLEVLGMVQPYQKEFSGSQFIEMVEFGNPPQNGWKAHPIVFKATHSEFGNIQIKTEVHLPGEAAPSVIYTIT